MTHFSQLLAAIPEKERRAALLGLSSSELAQLEYEWRVWAREDQLPPPGPWRTWLLLGGRGSGKTRTSVEWVRAEIEAGRRAQVGIIGPTSDALRRIQIEGPSGLLSVCPPWSRPTYEPSMRKVTWPNGAVCHLFSAEEPDRLRGPNLDAYWADEITSWSNPEAVWDMLQMCLRIPGPLGDPPCGVVSTTPKRQPLLKMIIAAPTTVRTRSKTSDNAVNLDASTLRFLNDKYGGTTLGRQELDAELLEDLEGALWNRSMIDGQRVAQAPELFRIVVGVDPAGSSGAKSDETGIIAVGKTKNDHFYVLRDASGKYSPDGWARRTICVYSDLKANKIVAEANFGGAMVEATIRAAADFRFSIPVKMVHASRGKQIRAEPVVALYEQGRVHHVGSFPALEDQMVGWDPAESSGSPDRVDALVWAISELSTMAQPHRVTLLEY